MNDLAELPLHHPPAFLASVIREASEIVALGANWIGSENRQRRLMREFYAACMAAEMVPA